MNTIELKEVHMGGLHLGIKYYANGKKIDRVEYNQLKGLGIANMSYSNSWNKQSGGVWSFYCTVKI